MTNEEFLKDVCPNHTEKSKWNRSELLHILEKHKEAINYSQCCTELKDKEALTFDEFVRRNFDTEDTQYYNKLGHKLWSEEEVIARYKLTKGNCL